MDLLSKSIGVLEKTDLAFQKLVSRGNVPKPAAFLRRIPTGIPTRFLTRIPKQFSCHLELLHSTDKIWTRKVQK